MGRILTILCIVVLVVGGIWWWRTYHSGNPYDGAVTRRDAAMENGTTTMENGQNLGDNVHPTPSRSDIPGMVNGEPAADSYDLGTQTTPITQEPYASTGPNAVAGQNAQPPQSGQLQNGSKTPRAPQISYSANTPYPPPMADSQQPNAPDGLRFSGAGAYQWYRQGNLTFRVDTQSGRSCVIYATMEEWRKPYVYQNGCRAS